MAKKKPTKPIIVSADLSLSEALRLARIEPGQHPNDASDKTFSSHAKNRGDSWDKGLDFDGMLEAARDGLEPTREFQISADKYRRETEITAVVYQHDTSGDEVDIGRYLSGETECFLDPLLTTKPGVSPIVEILTNTVASCGVEASLIERRGAAVYTLCETLEKSGKAVGITICSPISAPFNGVAGDLIDLRIRVKEPFEQVNTRRLYYFLTHPTVLRRLYFRLWEQQTAAVRERFSIHQGYGACAEIPRERVPAGTLYLESVDRQEEIFKSGKAAGEWITGLLDAQDAPGDTF